MTGTERGVLTAGWAWVSTSRWRALPRARKRPDLTGRDYAYNVDSEYNDGTHRVGFEYGRTGEDFNPEVGFLENEDGYRRVHGRYHLTMRQQKIRDWGFREWQPHVQYTRYDYLDGGLSQCRPPSRQPLGLGERQPHRHGAERRVGGIP